MIFFYYSKFHTDWQGLSKEQPDCDTAHDQGGEIGCEGGENRVAGIFDADSAIINSDGVKGGLGRALKNACDPSDQTVRAMLGQNGLEHGESTAARYGPQQGKRKDLLRNPKKIGGLIEYVRISSAPEALNMVTAIIRATRAGRIFTEVWNPSFAPSMKVSKTFTRLIRP